MHFKWKTLSFSLGTMLLVLILNSCIFTLKPEHVEALKPFRGRSIVFYNVENLFDTIDHDEIQDDDFAPEGRLKWDSKKYRSKLEKIVQAATNGLKQNPILIGLVEVENEQVVLDLARTGRLKDNNYEVVHEDSPDTRGIDCALLYDADRFQALKVEHIPVEIDSLPDFKTRDILYVKGQLQGERELHIFVNHWPSRRKGEAETAFKRAEAARIAKHKIDAILAENPNANILIMGDFNDAPDDHSIENILGAKAKNDKTALLINLFYDEHLDGKGTHVHDGEWDLLDQFIVSRSLYSGKNGIQIDGQDATIVDDEILLFTHRDGNQKPAATYGGDKYYGGFSDHLPIQLELK